MTVTIEQGVPVPPAPRRTNWRPLLDALNVGDSFAIPEGEQSLVRMAIYKYMRDAHMAASARAASGKNWTVRRQGGAYRCWRVQ